MSFENEFDLSNVTLKELQDIQRVIQEELRQIYQALVPNGPYQPEAKVKEYEYSTYARFLANAIRIKKIDEIRIKKIDEMNKTYFGTKITLKNKLPQAEVVEESVLAGVSVEYFGHVEYEPLFPVIPP